MTPTLIHGDCMERMAEIAPACVDLVLTDLPYGTTRNQWDSQLHLPSLWRLWHRVLRTPRSAVVLFTQQPFTTIAMNSNLKEFRSEWIWEKPCATGFLNARRYPMKAHENILVFARRLPLYFPVKTNGHGTYVRRSSQYSQNYARHGTKPRINTDGTRLPRSVVSFPMLRSDRGAHPTQKPLALCEYLIRTYTEQGMTVLDCCMGSGSTGVAALNTGRDFIGIEQDDTYFATATTRIQSPLGEALQ